MVSVARPGSGTSPGFRCAAVIHRQKRRPSHIGLPKYHASSSWQTMRISVSSRPPCRQSWRSRSFMAWQSPLSLSRTITNRALGSRQVRNTLVIFRSRSDLPLCGKHWKFKPGNKRGKPPSSRTCIEDSSSRKITLPTATPRIQTNYAPTYSRTAPPLPSYATTRFRMPVLPC